MQISLKLKNCLTNMSIRNYKIRIVPSPANPGREELFIYPKEVTNGQKKVFLTR